MKVKVRMATKNIPFINPGTGEQFGQVAMTRGLSRAPAGRATTVGYLQIAFATLLGAIVFDALPNSWSSAGIAMIVLSLLGTSGWFGRRAKPRTPHAA